MSIQTQLRNVSSCEYSLLIKLFYLINFQLEHIHENTIIWISHLYGNLNIGIYLLYFSGSSSFVSFTQCSPTCGCMPLPALSLWSGRQPYRPRLVGGRRRGGPSSVAPHSRIPPTGRRRDSPFSSSLFSHGPPLCAVG